MAILKDAIRSAGTSPGEAAPAHVTLRRMGCRHSGCCPEEHRGRPV